MGLVGLPHTSPTPQNFSNFVWERLNEYAHPDFFWLSFRLLQRQSGGGDMTALQTPATDPKPRFFLASSFRGALWTRVSSFYPLRALLGPPQWGTFLTTFAGLTLGLGLPVF